MGEREERSGQGPQGLYREENERDSCGIGFVADIKGRKSHEILKRGLEVLERMEHRGAESADNKTGDGSGVLMQIPHAFYKKLIPGLPDPGLYGTGLLFTPRPEQGDFFPLIKKLVEDTALYMGLKVLAWRDVPTDNRDIGVIAASAEPAVKQLVLVPEQGKNPDADRLGIEMRLYVFRKKIEKALRRDETLEQAGAKTYFVSLSSRTVVYKGMLMPKQLKDYYPELKDESLETAVAQVHSRFSTNTFPDWPLAQPFRLVSHNGEINTIKGNRFWMAAREALFSHNDLGPFLADICPVIEPGRSDSASFDNALELLVLAGRSLPHALMMLIPESWNGRNPIPDELKAFYEYSACVMEPWDGPASIVFCDGRYVGGTLDRNGLRPSRYTITRDQLIVMSSETGVQDFRPDEVEFKGRLLPGKLLLVDLEEGRIIPDDEVKREVVRMRPYREWVSENVAVLDQSRGDDSAAESSALPTALPTAPPTALPSALPTALPSAPPPDLPSVPPTALSSAPPSDLPAREALFMERAAGYTREDRDRLLLPMAEYGQEPTSSMGTDTPLAVFSEKSQRVYAYFKQLFAQVTNPPIDSIREDLVMTLTSFAGPQLNLLEETEAHCRRIKVVSPILTEKELGRLRAVPGFKNKTLDASFPPGEESLEAALDRLVSEAVRAVEGGASLVVLSDRAALSPGSGRCAVPALLAVGAAHHGLIKAGLRMKASIIAETAEPREIMHYALLFGYGADLVVPYGAFNSIALICRGHDGKRLRSYAEAEAQYVKGLQKAMLKVISKMGTSTLRSYRGAQIFEAVGLGEKVIEKCFRGTVSRIGGAGFAELEAEAVSRYREALVAWESSPDDPAPADFILPDDGQYRWRDYGEKHAWNPETIYLLQWAARTGDYAKFKQFTALADSLNRSPHVIRGLLDFAAPGSVKGGKPAPVPLEEVEPAEAVMARFTTGAMSLGSLSKEAHETIARTMNAIGSRSNSGEGGEPSERFEKRADGSWLRSAVKQVASARFGVTSEYLANAAELQIKIAQGAKPGEGGQLPGHKVDGIIARTRHSTPGVTLISPPPHHDIYSIEDLAELIFDLKNANPRARISVKLVSEDGVGTIAAGVAKAHADNILISGYDGGTGASPQSSIRHAGLPWELGISETHQVLVRNGLRGRVRLMTDGQLKTGRDIVIAGMLGAEEFGFGTSALIVLGCVMMRKCHENTCPMGVATQDPELRKRFRGKSEHLANFFRFLAEETREIMASLGFRKFDELIGHSEYLVERKIPEAATGIDITDGRSVKAAKVAGVDLSRILERQKAKEGIPGGDALYCTQAQVHKITDILDLKLIEKCFAALEKKVPTTLEFPVKNTDRSVGTMLSYEVSRRLGGRGLPENFITVDFAGSAGQSFGAFLARGITFRLAGDSNDYLGKGLSGGRIVVFPPEGSTFKTYENIIIGNTVLYGATSGNLYAAGVAGERFCVRNSGAVAVVEGTGDHCAEYMTGGRVIVLGKVGRNFAAGMSGGIAYVLDTGGSFRYFLNPGMVELSGLDTEEDEIFVREEIGQHIYWTGSAYARGILYGWEDYRTKFVKVLPVEYKKALQEMKLRELDRKLYDIRLREDIAERV